MRTVYKGLGGGVLIGLAGMIYLSVKPLNPIIAAFLFAIGLITILYYNLNLYTGKVGYLLDKDKYYALEVAGTYLGNFIGCAFVALAFITPERQAIATALLAGKILGNIFISGFFCGILMFIAVDGYKTKKTILFTLFCVPAFILAGFDHSIANIYYIFTAAEGAIGRKVLILLLSTLGNAVGGVFANTLFGQNEKN